MQHPRKGQHGRCVLFAAANPYKKSKAGRSFLDILLPLLSSTHSFDNSSRLSLVSLFLLTLDCPVILPLHCKEVCLLGLEDFGAVFWEIDTYSHPPGLRHPDRLYTALSGLL
jgi:hypothetical protein